MGNPAEAYRLRLLRLAFGFKTQRDFSDALGKSPQWWGHVERAGHLTTRGAFRLHARFGYVPIDWIWFGEVGNMPVGFWKKLKAEDHLSVLPPIRRRKCP